MRALALIIAGLTAGITLHEFAYRNGRDDQARDTERYRPFRIGGTA